MQRSYLIHSTQKNSLGHTSMQIVKKQHGNLTEVILRELTEEVTWY